MKKKILSLLLFLVMSLALAGCNFLGGTGGTDTVDLDEVYLNVQALIPNKTEIVGDMTLPSKFGSVVIVWSSSNPSVIDHTGKVTRPDVDTDVILSCTLADGTNQKTYQLRVTVKAKGNDTGDLTVAHIPAELQGTYYGDDVRVVVSESKVEITDPTGKTLSFVLYVEDDKFFIVEEGIQIICTFDNNTVSNIHGIFTKEAAPSEVSIAEVLRGTVGETYKTKGTVVAVSNVSFLVFDQGAYVLAYIGDSFAKDVTVGNEVSLFGATSQYSGSIQFSNPTYAVLGTNNVEHPNPIELDATKFQGFVSEATAQVAYVKVEGTLRVSGKYINLDVDGATAKGSLLTTQDLSSFADKNVLVEGYYIYVTGSSTKYVTIMATNVTETGTTPVLTESTVQQVLSGNVGDTYLITAQVVACGKEGLLLKDRTGYIYAYFGSDLDPNAVKEGIMVTLKGTTSLYGNRVQFNRPTMTVGTANPISHPEARELSFKDIDQFAGSDVVNVEYVKVEGLLKQSGKYYNIEVEGSEALASICASNTDYSSLNNKRVSVTGYVVYVTTSNSVKYVYILAREVVEVNEPQTLTVAHLGENLRGTYVGSGVTVEIMESSVKVIEPDGKVMEFVLYVDEQGYFVLEEGRRIYNTFSDNSVTNEKGTFVKNTSELVLAHVAENLRGVYKGSGVTVVVEESAVLVTSPDGGVYTYVLYVDDAGIFFVEDGKSIYCTFTDDSVTNEKGTFYRENTEFTLAHLNENQQGTYSGAGVIVVVGESAIAVVDATGNVYAFDLYVDDAGIFFVEDGKSIYCTFTDDSVTNEKGTFVKTEDNPTELDELVESISGYDNLRSAMNISLPTSIEGYDGYTIRWLSSNESVISSDGVVTVQDEDTYVEFNVLISNGESKAELKINLIAAGYSHLGRLLFLDDEELSQFTTYAAKGIVVGTYNNGFIVREGDFVMLAYKGSSYAKDLALGDEVIIKGFVQNYGGCNQFSNFTYEKTGTTSELENVDYVFIEDFDGLLYQTMILPVQVKGTIAISGRYVNFRVEDAECTGSIVADGNNYSDLDGKHVIIEGYYLYYSVSGSNVFVNVLATSVTEDPEFAGEELEVSSISDVLAGTVGEEYHIHGQVLAKSKDGFLVKDESGMIYVYMTGYEYESFYVADNIDVFGTTSVYGLRVQLRGTRFEVSDATDLDIVEARELDANALDELASQETLEIEYVTLDAVLKQSGRYYNLEVEGTEVLGSISNPIEDLSDAIDCKINVTGYLIYLTTSKDGVKYAYIMLDNYTVLEAPSDKLDEVLEIIENYNYLRSAMSISLPTSIEGYEEYSIRWMSSDEGVISSDGVVTVQDEDTLVEFSVMIFKDGEEASRVTVILIAAGYSTAYDLCALGDDELSQFTSYAIKATVLKSYTYGFVLEDETGMVLVYVGNKYANDLTAGDEVIVKGIAQNYGGCNQLSMVVYDTTGVKNSVLEHEFIEFDSLDLLTDEWMIIPVTLRGTLAISGRYTNFTMENSKYTGSLVNDGNNYSDLDGKHVIIEGYYLYYSVSGSNVFVNVLATSVTEDPEFAGEELEVSSISDVLAGTVGEEYHIHGQVLAKSKDGFLVKDESGMIYVYMTGYEYESFYVADNIDVFGTTSVYGLRVQLRGTRFEVSDATDLDIVEARELDANALDELASQETLEIEYVTLDAVLKQSGRYYNLEVEGTEVLGSISNPIEDLSDAIDCKINVTGYLIYLTTSKDGVKYAYIMLDNYTVLERYEIDINVELLNRKDTTNPIFILGFHDNTGSVEVIAAELVDGFIKATVPTTCDYYYVAEYELAEGELYPSNIYNYYAISDQLVEEVDNVVLHYNNEIAYTKSFVVNEDGTWTLTINGTVTDLIASPSISVEDIKAFGFADGVWGIDTYHEDSVLDDEKSNMIFTSDGRNFTVQVTIPRDLLLIYTTDYYYVDNSTTCYKGGIAVDLYLNMFDGDLDISHLDKLNATFYFFNSYLDILDTEGEGTSENPLTARDAYNLAAYLPEGIHTYGQFYIEGVISDEVIEDHCYFNLMVSEEQSLYVYGLLTNDGLYTYGVKINKVQGIPVTQGDKVLLLARVQHYVKNGESQLELIDARLIKVNDEEVSYELVPESDEQPVHAGTLDDPFDAYDAVLIARKLDAASYQQTDVKYYVIGVVQDNPTETYCNFNFGTELDKLYVYGLSQDDAFTVRYGSSREIQELPVAFGDNVLLCAYIQNYNGTPELKSAQLISVTSVTSEE